MALTADQARVADDAIAAVQHAADLADAGNAGRSGFLTWLTGSESSASASSEDARQTHKCLDWLKAQRPGLDAAGLVGFVEYASAGADVSQLLDAAHQASWSGFKEQVVDPSVAELSDDVQGIGAGALGLLQWAPLILVGLAGLFVFVKARGAR